MIEVKTADLMDWALDWAVDSIINGGPLLIKAEYSGIDTILYFYRNGDMTKGPHPFSTNWEQGGPLIEKYKCCLATCEDGDWCCAFEPGERFEEWEDMGYGKTPLIAACRAIVRAKFGRTISVPKELMQ